MTSSVQGFEGLIGEVAAAAREAGVFGEVRVSGSALECEASGAAEPASYRLRLENGTPFVELVMVDRWQSESIEADLMNSGDSLEELLEEELVDQGYEGGTLTFEHFRSDDMLFTFRSPLPASVSSGDSSAATKVLLAYEACFRQLGDMDSGGEEG